MLYSQKYTPLHCFSAVLPVEIRVTKGVEKLYGLTWKHHGAQKNKGGVKPGGSGVDLLSTLTP